MAVFITTAHSGYALIVDASLARYTPYLIVFAAGAALALAVGGVSVAKPALARLHSSERRRHRGR
jgi:hypothetical protein